MSTKYCLRLPTLPSSFSTCCLVLMSLSLFLYMTFWNRIPGDLTYHKAKPLLPTLIYSSLEQLLDDDFPSNIHKLNQGDPILQKYVKLRHLTPPSKLPYNLPGNGDFSNMHSFVINKWFRGKKDGVFIEAGAYDGVAASNTLYLEKVKGWRGLLVECNPYTVPALKMKRRKSWIADVCLSTTPYPATLNFSNPTAWTPSAKIGKPADLSKWGVSTNWTHFEVQAIPLFTLLSAINMTSVDFFSLDVEGAEFDVLKTIPFDNVSIKVIDMEVHFFSKETQVEIKSFMESNGYQLRHSFGADQLYVHSSANLDK